MRCKECRSKNVIEGITTEEWDFWHTEYRCGKCKNTWLVGDLKNPYTNPDTNPIKEGKKIVVVYE